MMKNLFRLIRPMLGVLILFYERNFPLRNVIIRSAQDRELLKKEIDKLALYEFQTCPFCVKVRRELQRLGVPIRRLDAQFNMSARNELKTLGHKIQVPCLRIETSNGPRMLYESKEIIAFLRSRFGSRSALF